MNALQLELRNIERNLEHCVEAEAYRADKYGKCFMFMVICYNDKAKQ